jgi:glycosyltransferase involved in cell wall biosynthesis
VKHFCERQGARLIVDIDDLPLYQAVDLEYSLAIAPFILRFMEKQIFAAAQRLTLSSCAFANVITKDYSVSEGSISIVHNGIYSGIVKGAFKDLKSRDFPLPDKEGSGLNDEDINIFYCGTLDPVYRRELVSFIQDFADHRSPVLKLYLAGPGGAWLDTDSFRAAQVFYLGSISETSCLQIGRQMSFGLIPYPEKPYYSKCFPSKLGLYYAAGLPVISSQLSETELFVERYHSGFSVPFNTFADLWSHPRRLLSFGRERSERYEETEDGSGPQKYHRRTSSYNWDEEARKAFLG